MPNPKRTVLGIEVSAREIRMVEMRGGAAQPLILKAGSVPLPAGAMDGDRIVQVEVVADLIRGLHNRLGCQTKTAVVGMGVQGVVTRILAIPRVPDSELRTVIEGELAHYQILRSGTGAGAFDYFRLESSSANTDTLPSVLLMAVEERIAQGYRLTIEKAGLQMLALEPITLSLFRAAYPLLETEPAALCLAITPQRSELSVLDHTQLRLYRRLEIGSNDFIVGRKGGGGAGGGPRDLSGGLGDTASLGDASPRPSPRAPLNPDLDDPTAELTFSSAPPQESSGTGPLGGTPMGGGSYGDIIPQAAASLANEVQRSLDYYRREFPNSTAIGRIILTTNDPEAEALGEWLSQALRMDVRLSEVPVNPSLPPQTVSQLETPQGLRFLGAAGLAMHALTPDWMQVPRFNLSVGGQGSAIDTGRERLTAMMIFSVFILIGGIAFAILNHQRYLTANDQRIKFEKAFGIQNQDVQKLEQQVRDEQALGKIIRADNLPVPQLLDTISRAMPPNDRVGISRMEFARDGKITIEGKAKDSLAYTSFVSGLLTCANYLTPPSMGNYTTDDYSNIVTFKVETALKGTQAARALGGGVAATASR